MLNLSDKELDRLSREAAEQFEPDEDFSSWEKLEQQLDGGDDENPPVSSPIFKAKPLGYGALLLLLVGASYFLLKSGNDKTHSTLKNQVSKETSQQSGTKQNTSDQKDITQKQTSDAMNKDQAVPSTTNDAARKSTLPSENATVDKNDHAGATEKASGSSVNSSATDQKKSDNENSIAKNKTASRPDNSISNNNNSLTGAALIGTAGTKNKNISGKNNHKNQGPQKLNNEVVAEPADANNSGSFPTQGKSQDKNNITITDPSDKSKYAMLPGLVLFDNAGAVISDSSLLKVATNTNNNTPATKNQALHINRSLKIGFMLAPDVTLVHSTSNDKFSTNVGITLGYQFAGKWSVNSGIIYTKKNYASQGKDFHPKWSSAITSRIDYVTGDCNMWEIPLSLRYDFASTNKNTFFVNAGLSSYLMKSESYDIYIRGWAAYPPVIQPYPQTKTNQKYWFSIASISAGMEHQFNKNFSLQVEPFMKIPLRGVGLGNLQLNSYGISFSLRYSPVLSKSRH